MSYTPYVTASEYAQMGYDTINPSALNTYLTKASRDVDTLTFNRIVQYGFNNLTEFQKGIIKQVVCEQANFLFENKDAINSILSSYSINSVAMTFGDGFNVATENGLPIQKTVYSLLEQTGLCWRGAV